MAGDSKPAAKRLPLLGVSQELTGATPRAFEKVARGCQVGDRAHRGLIRTCSALTTRGLELSLPPGPRGIALKKLAAALAWSTGELPYREVRKMRAALFDALPILESMTTDAIDKSVPHAASGTLLDEHGRVVVLRYAALSVHHSVAAALLTLDAVASPLVALDVISEVAGGAAYRDTAFSAARDEKLRADILTRAEWEYERVGRSREQSVGALALQLFHESLGVIWNRHQRTRTLYLSDFVDWACTEN